MFGGTLQPLLKEKTQRTFTSSMTTPLLIIIVTTQVPAATDGPVATTTTTPTTGPAQAPPPGEKLREMGCQNVESDHELKSNTVRQTSKLEYVC